MNIILRRRKLGRTSCREISNWCPTIPVRNDLVMKKVKEPVDWLIRWGCTSQMEAKHTVNKVKDIQLVNNKTECRKVLGQVEHKGKQIIPTTWFSFEEWQKEKQLPVIVRPNHHAQGRKLYFCNTEELVFKACKLCGNQAYISSYIPKQKEFRIFVMQGRVVWVAEKTPENPNAIAWNVAKGGTFTNVRWSDWPLKGCRIALKAMEAVSLDFGGVDIMQCNNDFYVLEINSAPSQTSPYRQKCTGLAIKSLIETNNNKYESPLKINSYKDCIHPAINTQE
jgi:glutathione synthase/RimK-type ligase-like ATP-grasp enzyme